MTHRRHRPTLTSYDYNAPLSENGAPDPKFFALQRLIKQYQPKNSIYNMPKKRANKALGQVSFNNILTLTDLLDKVVLPMGQISRPIFVEYLCKVITGPCKEPFYGFVAYRHNLTEVARDTSITLTGVVGDRIQVIVDGQLRNTTYAEWIEKPITIKVPVRAENRDLIILVENMGRVNYHLFNNQWKGFNGTVIVDATGREMSPSWQVYDLSFKKPIVERVTNSAFWRPIDKSSTVNQPAFYYASLTGSQELLTDQFLNFENWNKGVAFVNGFNLGRYWKVGPQKALYVPAPILSGSLRNETKINPDKALEQLKAFQPDKPLMIGEFWDGWFDRWGDERKILNESAFTEILGAIFRQNASVNLYMFHGGTNFGFMNGANADNTSNDGVYHLHRAASTSYDYNAPVIENGEADPKFFALQSLIQQYHPENSISVIPERPANRVLGVVQFSEFLTLSDLLDKILVPMGRISKPTYVEYLCSELPSPCRAPFYGFIAYRHSLVEIGHDTSIILSGVVGDRIQVIVDGRLLNTTYAQWIQTPVEIAVPVLENSRDLIILVENMGFEGNVTIESTGKKLSPDWLVYDLSFRKPIVENLTSSNDANFWRPISQSCDIAEPAIYFGKFFADQPITDQFLNFRDWEKGVVFINSFNLGRYWNVGPQKSLYVPAPLLYDGQNEIIMFELHKPSMSASIEFQQNAEWTEPINITEHS
uniref:Glycoside hydrolase 35 catalytic domain-containing protein n=1 Tax=Romanomermis culicivorax TaxID=13658 RepID=A0A915JKK3_ROMCU